jgi:3-oxoacyl-[acyl-carrier protein] reductase
MKLKDKVAIVTGSSKGIGAGIAKAFASEGAKVVINYSSSESEANKVVKEIQEQGGIAIAIKADISKSAEVTEMFDKVKLEFGSVDILVNNAAIAVMQTIDDLTEEAFHKQFNLNVLGYLLATKEAVKNMGDRGGSIINLSSYLSTDAAAGTSVYSATKGATDTITLALARELGPRKIRVNSILPGNTNTPATAGMFVGELAERALAGTPLGRFGEPEDIAPLALFLASDDSKWVTGESIRAAGGVRGVGY